MIGSVSPPCASWIILAAIVSLVTLERPEASLQTSSKAALIAEITSGPNAAFLRNGLIGTTRSGLTEAPSASLPSGFVAQQIRGVGNVHDRLGRFHGYVFGF